jgi:hypothetical protein
MIAVLREFGPIDEKAAAALLRWTRTKMTRNPREKDGVFDFVFDNGQSLDWLQTGDVTGILRRQYRARDYKMPPDQK